MQLRCTPGSSTCRMAKTPHVGHVMGDVYDCTLKRFMTIPTKSVRPKGHESHTKHGFACPGSGISKSHPTSFSNRSGSTHGRLPIRTNRTSLVLRLPRRGQAILKAVHRTPCGPLGLQQTLAQKTASLGLSGTELLGGGCPLKLINPHQKGNPECE